MATGTDAQSLLTQAACYTCFGDNLYMLKLMELGLLRQLVLQGNPVAAVDPQSLLSAANCYLCFGDNLYMLQLMELGLLQTLAGGPGTGGAGGVARGNGSPVGQFSPVAFVMYVQLDSAPPNQVWTSNGSVWTLS